MIHPSWQALFDEEWGKPYFKQLSQFLRQAYAERTIYPPRRQVFSAFATDLRLLKVVIMGQDPYHGAGQAHGLAFSVAGTTPIPPSLRNIFAEIHTDTGAPLPTTGNLQHWAEQGVLLLNNVLTVEAGQAGSHRGRGWEQFTDAMLAIVNSQRQNVVFMLWGRDARAKRALLDDTRHLILEAPHPSPLSAFAGFFGCRHFSRANTYLQQHGQQPIAW